MNANYRTALANMFVPTLVFCALAFAAIPASAQWDRDCNHHGRNRAIPNTIRLEPGDVVLAVNGNRVHCVRDFLDLVNGSGRFVSLTIRDSRTGNILSLETRLRDCGIRLGVNVVDNHRGRGVRIVSVTPNSPATQCMIDRQGNNGWGNGTACELSFAP